MTDGNYTWREHSIMYTKSLFCTPETNVNIVYHLYFSLNNTRMKKKKSNSFDLQNHGETQELNAVVLENIKVSQGP